MASHDGCCFCEFVLHTLCTLVTKIKILCWNAINFVFPQISQFFFVCFLFMHCYHFQEKVRQKQIFIQGQEKGHLVRETENSTAVPHSQWTYSLEIYFWLGSRLDQVFSCRQGRVCSVKILFTNIIIFTNKGFIMYGQWKTDLLSLNSWDNFLPWLVATLFWLIAVNGHVFPGRSRCYRWQIWCSNKHSMWCTG